mmetsp:Transcript_9847/g.14748  ORF Transcript_9847/g.14748 Transcript_9847/m.14748 type:complete len:104 (-) Transcript_9847:274-585(-)
MPRVIRMLSSSSRWRRRSSALQPCMKVKLIGGAQSKNIFWLVGTSVTLGATSEIEGTMMAGASITMGGAAKISGRMLAKTGTVTLDAASIQLPASPVGNFHLH